MISEETVERAIELMKKGGTNYEHFFAKADSPDWIDPLAKKGFFANPPSVIREGGYIQLPFWPESQFLARVADKAPKQVADLFLKLPSTENSRVYEDMAEAALAMPVEEALKLAEKLALVATAPYSFFLPERLTDLAIKFCKAGKVSEGVRLLTELLRLESRDEGSGTYRSISVVPKIGQHELEEVLAKVTADVTPLIGLQALSIVIKSAVEYFQLSTESKDVELTWMERPAIEEHQQNLGYGALDPIIDAVRDIAITLTQAGLLAEVVAELEEPQIALLRRVAMHVLSNMVQPDLSLVRSYLVNRENYDSNSLHHEYFRLLKGHFGKLMAADQEVVLKWIDEEDDPGEIKKLWETNGRTLSDEEAANASSYRRLAHLTPVEDYLTGDRKAEYEGLVAKHGEPEHPDFLSYHGEVRTGFVSPVQAEELASMSPAAIAEYIRNWVPGEDTFDGPTMEGLGHRLEDRVKADPEPFADAAPLFKGLDPTYVRSLLSGIEESVRNGKKPNWEAVLDMASWAVTQKDDPNRKSAGIRDKDPDWGWARKEIAGFLVTGLGSQVVEPPIEFRETIWSMLENLASDAEPTPTYEATYGGSNMNPPTLALNTIRPTAIRGVILYALWVFRSTPKGEFTVASKVPEAEKVLREHLDASKDPSLAVRSVYGQFSPWIAMMDESWFDSIRPSIFDRAPEMEEFWHAAWDTYITHCRGFDQMLRLLREEYRHAIDRTNETTKDSSPWSAVTSLGEHLLVFYGRKQLELASGSLIDYYLDHTSPEARKRGLGELGHGLFHSAAKVEVEFSERFVPLWESLVERASAKEKQQRADLIAFGWWFASGVLPLPWSIQTLLKILALAPSIDLAHAVIEKLAKEAADYPKDSLTALALMFDQKMDRTDFYQREEVTTILKKALESDATEQATLFIHKLGAAGIKWPGDLLKKSSTSD